MFLYPLQEKLLNEFRKVLPGLLIFQKTIRGSFGSFAQNNSRGLIIGVTTFAVWSPSPPHHRGLNKYQHTAAGGTAVHASVCLHVFGLFLGPLRYLLFFRRQGRFLLIFSLIFEFFRHGVRS